jgi:hypothetical protein
VDARGDGNGAFDRVQFDPPPARSRLRPVAGGRQVAAHLLEVTVVAEFDEGRPDGRVHDARGPHSHHARHLEGLEEQWGDPDRPSLTHLLHPPELRVVAESAAGLVDGRQLAGQQGEGLVSPVGGGHRH